MEEIPEPLLDWLVEIDRRLSRSGVPVKQRPFHCATMCVRLAIIEVREGEDSSPYAPDLSSTDFVSTRWFRGLFKAIDSWYRDRYGAAYVRDAEKPILGLVLVYDTPVCVRIPTSRIRPAEEAGQIWLGFPDHIEDDDVPIDWLVDPPNLARLTPTIRATLESDLREIAGGCRFIRTNWMGVAADDEMAGFQRGVLSHIERAAELIAHMEDSSIQQAWWELQMSLEGALKGLILQKAGAYPFSHRLPVLFDRAEALGCVLDREPFADWPDQDEVMGLRYGHGTRHDVAGAFEAYRRTIQLACAAVDRMERLHMGKGQFKLQQPPWMRD